MLRGIRPFVFASHPAWIIVLGDMDKFDDTHTKMSWSLCASVWMAADAHSSPSLYEQRLLGTERILLIWTLMKSPARLPLSQLSFSSLFFFLIPSTPLSCRRRRLPVRAVRKRRHLHRQGWFIPLPLPAQLWRRHMRERWEWGGKIVHTVMGEEHIGIRGE